VLIDELRRRGVEAVQGDVAQNATIKQLHLDTARLVVIAMSDPVATRHVVDAAHRLHPDLPVIARTHSESERRYLLAQRVDAILAEQELALTMNRHALARLGCPTPAEPAGESPVTLPRAG